MKIASIGFQEYASPIMEGIVWLHDYIGFFLIIIAYLVIHMLGSILFEFGQIRLYPNTAAEVINRLNLQISRLVTHAPRLEVFWTVTPSLILIIIAIPSFALLYTMDDVLNPQITFKAIGHQWYWSYEYSDYASYSYDDNQKMIWNDNTINFDSNLVYENELKKGEFRLLQVDNPVVLPTDIHVRVIITSLDVLHSWAVPSLGVKVDGCPGRLNQVFLFIKRQGVFYGQCSELCGVNHAFMPIVVKAVSYQDYISWLLKMNSNLS